ncbi:MAG: N-acetylneuraminate synthase family protein [Candidatus Omnitrophica bacterium]|nr:N-acetylneuraminate synthase family protein [Candidatus Omnitrophota bacterium]
MTNMNFNKITKPYLIAEVGINHNGDLQLAKKLIDAAHACSWNCVKFQKRNPDSCVPEKQKSVMKDTPWGTMSYLEYKHKLEFGEKEYDYIDAYCKEKPIQWGASIWDIDSLRFIKRYDVAFIKIPSAKITDHELVVEASKTHYPLIVSTGMSTVKEIDTVVETVRKHTLNFILMHTNSSYPTKIQELNLHCIKTLRERYKCAVGYSGHEYGLEPTAFAAVLGAMVIERHITLDHTMWGTDQAASVEPMGMDMLYKRIRDVNTILGDGKRTVTESETIIRKKLRGH